MIKSLLESDEEQTDKPPRASGPGPNVLGIFGDTDAEPELRTSSQKAPFDLSEIDDPYRPRGEQKEISGMAASGFPVDSEHSGTTGFPAENETVPASLSNYKAPTAGETIRMSGLAWSAGIVLFGSIVFMTMIGWLADLLLGSSPWGIVVGIVLGSAIGFVQLVRINTEIIRTAGSSADKVAPLSLSEDDRGTDPGKSGHKG